MSGIGHCAFLSSSACVKSHRLVRPGDYLRVVLLKLLGLFLWPKIWYYYGAAVNWGSGLNCSYVSNLPHQPFKYIIANSMNTFSG